MSYRNEAFLRCVQLSAHMGEGMQLWRCYDYLNENNERLEEGMIVSSDANCYCSKRDTMDICGGIMIKAEDRCIRDKCPFIVSIINHKMDGYMRSSEHISKKLNALFVEVGGYLNHSNTPYTLEERSYAVKTIVEAYANANVDPKPLITEDNVNP